MLPAVLRLLEELQQYINLVAPLEACLALFLVTAMESYWQSRLEVSPMPTN
jgi:hypothetical protein